MPEAKLRALFRTGMPYKEVAKVNERVTGWLPSESGVARKFEALGMPRRYESHGELIPWRIRPEHARSRIRHMLEAESRRRAGVELSRSDKALISLLQELLYGRGRFLVIGYVPAEGFCLYERASTDRDIIRAPGQNLRDDTQ